MRNRRWALLFGFLSATFLSPALATHDIVIYGGTSAAITAAIQAQEMGKSVVIVSPDKRLGGLSSGGLGWTDSGNKAVIGGLSREFYHRIWKHYQDAAAWKWQKRESYGNRGQGGEAIEGDETMWIFEPSAAERVFEEWIAETGIEVVKDAWLDRSEGGVKVENGRILSFRTLDGKEYKGRIFVDATYEGDLIAAAGVTTHVGREGKEAYGEEWNGVQTGVLHHSHHFDAIPNKVRIDPYVVPGDPNSGVLPHVSADPPGEKHSGDHRVQAYCFRMCLTDHPENRIPFPKPEGYDPANYELLVRIFDAGWRDVFHKFDPVPNRKTDTNNHGPFSTDFIGGNYEYPEASYEERRAIIKAHEDYQMGWLYFIANDPRVPPDIQKKMNEWGLPRDEYTDNENWSPQLYIREARRLVGHFVMTENELLQRSPTPDSVGMGSYTIDSHNVQRYITPQGYVQNEGDIGVKCRPYQIAYGSLVPKREECTNLLAPVCVSSSHIAFGSIRMEPVFMLLGQSAATAASLAIDSDIDLQDVDYSKLRARLLQDGQVLEYTALSDSRGLDPEKLEGTVIDDEKAKLSGGWKKSSSIETYVGFGYQHDNNSGEGCTAEFSTTLDAPGVYEVFLAYSPEKNRASNVNVKIVHLGGEAVAQIDQRTTPPIQKRFLSLGDFEFGEAGTVTVSNEGADGFVVIDAVQWVLKESK